MYQQLFLARQWKCRYGVLCRRHGGRVEEPHDLITSSSLSEIVTVLRVRNGNQCLIIRETGASRWISRPCFRPCLNKSFSRLLLRPEIYCQRVGLRNKVSRRTSQTLSLPNGASKTPMPDIQAPSGSLSLMGAKARSLGSTEKRFPEIVNVMPLVSRQGTVHSPPVKVAPGIAL